MEKFCLDRSAFKATTAGKADDHVTDWKNKTPRERMAAAFFLIYHAYGVDEKTPLDRTVFSKRRRPQ